MRRFYWAALSKRFMASNYKVIGIDNLNNYYNKKLKYDRLNDIEISIRNKKHLWKFYMISIDNEKDLNEIFLNHKPNIVINLAAQAGVRFSLKILTHTLNQILMVFLIFSKIVNIIK